MSGMHLSDSWGHVLPALDPDDATSVRAFQVRAFQVRAVGWGAAVGYSIGEQRDMLEALGLLLYRSALRAER